MNINANKLNGYCSSFFKNSTVTNNTCFKTNLDASKKQENKFRDGIAEINRPGVTDNVSRETQRILLKFRSGKKLSPAELEHLRQTSPQSYQKIRQMQMDRERLEAQLRAAKTQEEADRIYMNTLDSVSDSNECPEDKETRMNQYADAYFEDRKRRAEEEKTGHSQDDKDADSEAEKIE